MLSEVTQTQKDKNHIFFSYVESRSSKKKKRGQAAHGGTHM
jgi:hypothetical protein